MTGTQALESAAADLSGPSTAPCCGLSPSLALSREEAERTATLLKAVADPTRLQLLALIRASEGAEACVCDLVEPVGLSQPTVSHHLKVLTEAGLLRREKRGPWAWFALVPERLEDLAGIFR
jgi:ArsR family transcriptional regulator, arsenate/arsenite/antimonite-responsive transcriptional repressor